MSLISYHIQRGPTLVPSDRIPKQVKELRGRIHSLKVKKLVQLDRSDRVLVEQMLERIINELYRIEAIGNAQCSCVLELYERMGGVVATTKS
jgi:hypothetical protein